MEHIQSVKERSYGYKPVPDGEDPLHHPEGHTRHPFHALSENPQFHAALLSPV